MDDLGSGETMAGTLYIVATPLGNLEDMTYRAVSMLKQVDVIAAEDTRHSKKLLHHYGIDTRLVSCHEHNEKGKIPGIVKDLKHGCDVALISDAGTPLVSDPGYQLVKTAAAENIRIIPIPGCSAAIAGLSVSGLATDSFLFLGFVPKKRQQRKQFLDTVKTGSATLILYESPKRIKRLIDDAITVLGDRNACLAREMTKVFEEYIRGKLSIILDKLGEKTTIKGECTLIVEGAGQKPAIDETRLYEIVQERVSTTRLRTSDLAREMANEMDVSKKKVYDMIIGLKKKNSENRNES